ncbi:unnamed protein product, partial [Phaeothamnion confervicola]
MAVVAAALRHQQEEWADAVRRAQRSAAATASICRRAEAAVAALASKDRFWRAIDYRLEAHVEAAVEACCKVEAVSERGGAALAWTPEVVAEVAGNLQRVAKLVAAKADHTVLARLTAAHDPTAADVDWDAKVMSLRESFSRQFATDCRRCVDKRYPPQSAAIHDTRDRFFVRVERALRVAASKHAKIEVGKTLFGKLRLDPACIACNRPFGPQPGPGDPRSALPEGPPLPRKGGRSAAVAVGSDGGNGGSAFVPPGMGNVGGGGGCGRSGGRTHGRNTQYVYRGGFKLPKSM